MSNIDIIDICDEAISHCRWKTVLKSVLEKEIHILVYKNKSFEEIFEDIHRICKNVKGIGMLSVYDIVSAICRFHSVVIEHVHIIGSGPVRAIKLLNLQAKKKKIGSVLLQYVSREDVVNAFQRENHIMYAGMDTSTNGDDIESYICNWQKTIM